MSISKHPSKGSGWWQIRISNGRKAKADYYTFEGTEIEAKAYEAELKGIPLESNQQKITDVLSRYLDWQSLHRSKKTCELAASVLPQVINIIGDKYIGLLHQTDYNRYKLKRTSDGVKKRTINIELTQFRSLLRYCTDELKMTVGDWPKLYTKKQTAPPSKNVLTPDEIAWLLEELHGDKKTIVMLYAFCGLRRSEALLLQRRHVDTEAGVIYVTGKGEKSRIVPIIGEELKERLEDACIHWPKMRRGKQVDPNDQVREKHQDEYLFICARTGKPYLNIKKALKAAAERAGITKPVWNHLMRHSGATAAVQAGVNIRSLQEMLGHSDIRMTEIYTHMSAEIMKQEGQKMAALHKASLNSLNKNKKKVSKLEALRRQRN